MVRLSEIFGCDLDYLIGRIDEQTHDIQFIHEKTGLSEDAIKVLMGESLYRRYKFSDKNGLQQIKQPGMDTVGELLSKIITHKKFPDLLREIHKITNSDDVYKYVVQNALYNGIDAHYATVGFGDLIRFDAESFFKMFHYQITTTFSEILDDITDRKEDFTKAEILEMYQPANKEEADKIISYYRQMGKLSTKKRKE